MTGPSIGIELSNNGTHHCTILDATGQLAQRFTFESAFTGVQKLELHICTTDPAHGAPVVVMEPTGLAWFLRCLRQHTASLSLVRFQQHQAEGSRGFRATWEAMHELAVGKSKAAARPMSNIG